MDLGRTSAPAGSEGDEDRWAQAQSILDDQPTQEADRRLRRFRRSVWLRIGGALVVAAAVGVLVGVLAVGSDGSVDGVDVPAWQEVSGLVVQGVGVVVEIVGFVVMRRAGMFGRGRWSVPGAVLTRRQRTSLLRQVQGRQPVDPRRLSLVRDAARRMVVARAQLLLLVGILAIQVGQAVSSPSTWRFVLAAALVVLYVRLLAQLEGNARRAERFLAAHRELAVAG
jgi:hypothetical protein